MVEICLPLLLLITLWEIGEKGTLTGHPIDTLELQSDEDIEQFRKMVERGELFDWEQESSSLIEVVNDFEFFCWEHLDEMMTVEERVKQLISNGDLPQYMKDKY